MATHAAPDAALLTATHLRTDDATGDCSADCPQRASTGYGAANKTAAYRSNRGTLCLFGNRNAFTRCERRECAGCKGNGD